MDDASSVGCLQSLGDLPRHCQGFVNWHWASSETMGKGLSLHEFQDQETRTVGFFEPVDGGDVWMAQ
jgi:hypothetical protein